MIDRPGKKIGCATADSFEGGVEGIATGHDHDMQAGATAEGAVEKRIGFGRIEMKACENEATTTEADESQSFLSVASGKRLVAHVGNNGGERFALGRIIVKDAGSEGGAKCCYFNGLISCVGHAGEEGKRCAKDGGMYRT